MTRVVYDDHGRGVEYLSALYRPDLHSFQMEMTRTGIGAERRWSPVSSLTRPGSDARPVPGRGTPRRPSITPL
jgi:GntR family transcriptional regulator